MEVIALSNQKGGVGKTTSTVNLGVALAKRGNKVLLLDSDPQASLSTHLGIRDADELKESLSSILKKMLLREPIRPDEGILKHKDGVDFLPGNIELEDIALNLPGIQDREFLLQEHINTLRPSYDYILIDCGPNLGILNVNALTAADSVIIPVQPQHLSMKGLEMLMRSIKRTQQRFNPNLKVKGVLFTLVDRRTVLSREVIDAVQQFYGAHVPIFNAQVPVCIKASEAVGRGESAITYDPQGKATQAYMNLAREVVKGERTQDKNRSAQTR